MTVRTDIRNPKHIYRIVSLGVFALLLANAACAPSPAAPQADTWTLTPPMLVTADETTYLERLDIREVDKTSSLKSLSKFSKLALDSHIAFARPDIGLEFQYRTQCENETREGKGKTSITVLLASLLPPVTVHRALLGADAKDEAQEASNDCSIEILVFSSSGSSHGFKLKDFALRPSLAEQNKLALASSLNTQARLKILCGSWWAEEDLIASNMAADFQRRLEALSTGPVNGADRRAESWNPTCATFQIDHDGNEFYLGRSNPLQNSRRVEVQESFVLNHTLLWSSTRQSLGNWKIINRSNFSQVLRLDGFASKIRIAVVSSTGSFVKWSRPVLLDLQLSFANPGAHAIRNIGGKTYLHLAPQQAASIEAKILTDAFCYHAIMAPGVPALRFETERALVLEQTSANLDSTAFAKSAEMALTNLPIATSQTLLHRADLAPNEQNSSLVRMPRSSQESFVISGDAKPSCIGGTYLGSSSHALPE